MMEINRLMNVIDGVVKDYESSLSELDRLEKELEKNRTEVETLTHDIALYEEVRVFLQELAEIARGEVATGLERVVTLCLQAVFGETMSFEIEIDTSRNNTAVHFYVVNTDGEEVVRLSPEESMGGGVVDTVAIGLRFGMLKILKPEPVGPIILDEPAKMVSNDLMSSVASLLQELTHMFEKQNILVTHHESLVDVVDNAVHFTKVDGISVISWTTEKG